MMGLTLLDDCPKGTKVDREGEEGSVGFCD